MPVFSCRSVILSGLLGSVASVALAQTPPQPQRAPTVLDTVTSSATRTDRAIGDVPATVTVIDSEEIDRRNVNNTRDLIRYEPGVSVSNNPTRSGRGSYVIRGIGENRVLMTIDGVRVPDFPANSQPGTFARDYIDLESIKRVEIVRGPASALYGSDAIGGVVAYVTKDPSDYLNMVGKDWYVSGKAGFASADTSYTETATAAGRNGPVEAMLLATRRDGSETSVKGSAKAPNPEDYDVNNLLGKLVFRATDVDRLRIIGEYTDRSQQTDVRTDVGPVAGAPGTSVTDSKGDDFTRRRRLSLDHTHDAPIGFIDRVLWRTSYQEVDRDEHSEQRRTVGTSRRLRVTDQSFSQDISSIDLQLESNADLWLQHRFTYGFDVDFTNSTRPRDRTEFNLTTGTSTKTVAGEVFPNKTFPDTHTTLGGVYLQDEMTSADKRLSIIPAIRFDYYNMKPSPDFAFLVNAPGVTGQVSDVSETAVSPKLGAVYKLTDIHSTFAQYSHGFRSPPYDDANIGFTNFAFGYRILPNPNLQPETSDSIEAGFRGAFKDGSSYQISTFYSLYKNFIEQRQIGVDPGGFLLFQSQNLDKVEIYGAEAKGDWRITDRVSLLGAIAYAHGTDKQTGLPVDSIDPLKLVSGLRYEDPKDWGVEFVGTGVARKSRVSDLLPGARLRDLRSAGPLRHRQGLHAQRRRLQPLQQEVLDLAGHGRIVCQQSADRAVRAARHHLRGERRVAVVGVGAVRHIRPHGLATRPAGAFSHASPVLRLVWPALRAGERAQRLAASWPWRATCISMALHVAAILAVIAWVPSPQKSAASVATEVAFWPGPEAPSGAVQAPSAQLPAEPLTEVKTAVADAAPAVPETTRAVEPSANTPAASPTAPPDVSAVPVAATTAEAVPVETAEALREPPPVQVARALPSPPAPRPAPAKPVAAKPAAVKAPPPAARPAETSAPAPVAGAPTNAPSTTVAALPAAAADSAEPPVVYEPRYRIPPTPPRFPPRALELNQQGTVVVRALVAPDGTSGEIIVWRSSGYALLDAAALRAVRDWAFEPASVGGRRIASWVEVPVRFAIR